MLQGLLFICGLPLLGVWASSSVLNCSTQTSEGPGAVFREGENEMRCVSLSCVRSVKDKAGVKTGKVGCGWTLCTKWPTAHSYFLQESDRSMLMKILIRKRKINSKKYI